METGNPKQVAVLGVLAVGAAGFLLARMGGKPAPASAAALAVARLEDKPRPSGTLTIGRDPFSHPRLATRTGSPSVEPGLALGMGVPTVPKPKGLAGAFPAMGPLPPADGLGAPAGPVIAVAPSAEKPATTGPERTTIGLEAVVGASDAVAFLTVGGADSQPFRPKARVAGAIRLLRVGDGTVVLEGPRGRVTLDVGERKSL